MYFLLKSLLWAFKVLSIGGKFKLHCILGNELCESEVEAL